MNLVKENQRSSVKRNLGVMLGEEESISRGVMVETLQVSIFFVRSMS